jgi:hypothetical protein
MYYPPSPKWHQLIFLLLSDRRNVPAD